MKGILMIRRYVLALAAGFGAAVALVSGVSLRAGQQPTIAAASGLTGDGRTLTRLPDGRVLMTGGMTGEIASGVDGSVFVFDPVSQLTIRLASRLLEPRAWHTATILSTGAILITGGVGVDGQPLATAERFDLATEALSPVVLPGASARAGHTATLLTDGRVLVSGGIGESRALVTRTEVWNIEAGAVAEASGVRARVGHMAALIADGQVLISGGTSAAGERVAGDDIFDPRSGRAWVSDTSLVEQPEWPLIAEAQPRGSARDVPLDANISLRFSQRVQPEALNEQTVVLSNTDGSVPVRVVAAENGRLAFVWPRDRLQPETTYRLTVANVRNLSDVALPSGQVTFTTVKAPNTTETEDEEVWTPDPSNPAGWQTRRPPSPWQSLAALQAAPGVTAVAGQVLTLDGRPLRNVTLAIEDDSTRTDNTGRFLLRLPDQRGRRELKIDGVTANRPNKTYGFFEYGLTLESGKTKVLPFTIWMPRLDLAHEVTVPSPTVTETVITNPHIPGLELHLPPRTVIRGEDGAPVTRVGITPIPVDRPPFPLAKNVEVPVYFTVQPGGAYVHTSGSGASGAWLVYPNYGHAEPGQALQFFHYDPEEKDWYVYGVGTVARNGAQVVPDAKTRLYEFTGAMLQTGDPVPGGGWTPGGPGWADPVDPSTGVFVLHKTDLYLADVIPIALTRTYNSADSAMRPFGRGMSHLYAMFLWSAQQWQQADLILPEGGRVHFVRTSAGTSWVDAVFVHQETQTTSATPTNWYKSVLSWNGNGWNLQLTDGTVFVFGENAPLQRIRDRYGNTLTITRTNGQSGNITRVTSPNGRWIAFTYDAGNRVTQATDNIGRTVRYAYDAAGNLADVTDAENHVTAYTWTASNQLATITDPRNITFLRNTYTNGRVSAQSSGDGTATTQFAYTVGGSGNIVQTDITDPRGNRESLLFNSDHYIVSDGQAVGLPEQRTHTFERRAGSNHVTAAIDGLGRRTELTYDAFGHVIRGTRLAGTANAATTTVIYEPRFFQPESISDPLGHVYTFSYDLSARPTGMTDPLGRRTGVSVDSSGRLVSASNALQQVWQFGYRGAELATVTDPLNAVHTLFADAVGRVVAATNPLGHTTRFTWNRVGQLTTQVDATGGQTALNYDGNGNLLEVVDAGGHSTRYSYDAFDRLSSRTDPASQMESQQYDGNDNLTRTVDRKGQATSYQYDVLDRLSLGTFADGSTISYAYDAGDRLLQMTDSLNGTLSWQYDLLDRVVQESTPSGTISYTYDADGHRTTMSVPGQSTVTYEYNAAHQLTGVTQGIASVAITYDDAGRRRSLTFPNGVVADYTYDAVNRLTNLGYSLAGAQLGDLRYAYDAVGNPTSVDGSLARTLLPQGRADATYDAANRITVRAGAMFSYDPNGNLTSDGLHTFQWSARNLLSSISGNVSAVFQYDALGRRRARSAGGTTTQFMYDGQNIVQEQTANGVPVANMLTGLGIDETFQRADGAINALLRDALGSTVGLADASGALQTEYAYEPFGRATASGAPSANATQFTGRENDGTGLLFYRARYYSPELGRFLSEDPLGLAGGDANLYAYVGNAPTRSTDPWGLYNRDVHFDLTDGIGRQVGMCTATAIRIAAANQRMDEDSWTSPIPPENVDARRMYHFTSIERLETLRSQAFGSGTTSAMGMYLHALQDSFSHQTGRKDREGGPYNPFYGHLFKGHRPDDPRDRPNVWRRMAQETSSELWQFHRLYPSCQVLR
jgi:RHS repeat-associated protein